MKNGIESRYFKRWTEEEIEYLRTHYRETDEFLSINLGRTSYAVHHKRKELKLKKGWSENDVQILKDNFHLKDYELSSMLNRTKYSVKWKRLTLGLIRDQPNHWSMEDIVKLQNNKRKSLKVQCKLLGRSKGAVSKMRIRLGIANNKNGMNVKYRMNLDFFKKWTIEMAYVLGLIYADGYLSISKKGYKVGLCSKDKTLLVKVKNAMESNYPIKRIQKGNNSYYTYHVYRKKIIQDLLKLGLTPRKSLTMEFPRIHKKYYWHFIRGYFDGDGHIGLRPKNSIFIAFYSGSKKFLDKLKFDLQEKGLATSLKKDRRKDSCFELSILFPFKEVFYENVYRNAKIFLGRKKNKFSKYYGYECP